MCFLLNSLQQGGFPLELQWAASHREASSRGKARDGAEVCASSSLLAVGRWGAKLTPGQLPPSRRWGLHPGFALHGSERWPDQDPFLG